MGLNLCARPFPGVAGCLRRSAMQHDAGMKLHHEISYAAPLGEVFAMLSDPAFRHASGAAMGVISADVTITPKGEGISVHIDQVQPTEGVPGFARKFAGETTRAVQDEEWSSPAGGTLTIETPGKPTSVKGTLSLTESGGRTTETLEAEVKGKVPLIGGKLDSLMADLVTKGMDMERLAGVAWLEGNR
jgi:uncharacterized protein YndB with AHSA1/START domain